jgi:hypothetical protein
MAADDQPPTRDEWLAALIARSPVLADASSRKHWQRLVAWLPAAARDELASILLDVEQACQT